MAVFNSLGSNYQSKHLAQMIIGFDAAAKKKFESFLADRYKANVQLTYKGREALYLALDRLNLKEGDAVAINGYTCYAVYDAVTAAKLVPVYVDIQDGALNYDLKNLKAGCKKNQNVKAVIIQNTLGFPADIVDIEDFCRDQKLHIIEDLAHSIGMIYHDGREAGTISDAALSFSQDKVVDSVSGGALIYRGNKQEFKTARLKYFKFLKDYYYIWNTMFIRSGYNWGGGKVYNYGLRKLKLLPKPMDGHAVDVRRPDNWHASLALSQFKDLDKTIKHRQLIASIYRAKLPIGVQYEHTDNVTYLRFPLRVNNPASLISDLKRSAIYVSDTWYESPISPDRTIEGTNYKSGSCPISESSAVTMVNLPTHVNIDEYDAERISEKVNKWLSLQNK